MLAATLGRHVGDRTLENLEQCLLNAFTADIARDGGVFVLLGDLVDFVDIDNALLGLLDITIGCLEQLEDDVFDVFPDVAGLGQRRGIHDGERHIEHAGKRLGQQGFAGARGADQKDVGLAELDFAGLLVEENALVVVVNGDSEFFLGAILADNVAVQELLNLGRAGKAARRSGSLFPLFVFEDGLANANALVADVRPGIVGRRTDELLYLFLGLMTEGTAKRFIWAVFIHVYEGLSPGTGSGSEDTTHHSRPIFLLRETETTHIGVKRKTYWKPM